MKDIEPSLLGKLDRVENHFLQVLLSRFDLRRREPGFELQLEFNGKTPAIWSSKGKRHVQTRIIESFNRKSSDYQRQLDAVLIQKTASRLCHDDPGFLFRYGSGGTLPVIRMDGKEYYCLFYREVFPIGWNIANGGNLVSRVRSSQHNSGLMRPSFTRLDRLPVGPQVANLPHSTPMTYST